MRIKKENGKDIFGWGGQMSIKKEENEKIYLGEEKNEDWEGEWKIYIWVRRKNED